MERIYNDVLTASGTEDVDVMFQHTDAVSDESIQFFFEFANKNLDSRRPMWQLMLGGVFDRHPDLKVMLTEIRIDWIPATLEHLDTVYDQHRSAIPARRKPSEYWPTNFLAGASFIHKAEVGDASRDGRRDHPLRSRLPAPREHVAAHQRVAACRVRRRSRRRTPTDVG